MGRVAYCQNLKVEHFLKPMKTLLAIAAIALGGCSSMPKQPPLRTVDYVDLNRFMGDWHVIATIPWFVEKNNLGTMDIYKLRPDGKIDIRYAFHKKSLEAPRQEMRATATVVNTKTNAQWAVQFLWPFKAPFLVIDLSPDYRHTTIGYPDRSLIWIMSRDPVMSEKDYTTALERAHSQGYDISRIVKVPQKSEAKP
jgi:apolipoprotein D and lipocalin family protein